VASDWLVPRTAYHRFLRERGSRYPLRAVEEFAEGIGRHPGIVVGRLQFDGRLSYKYSRRTLATMDGHGTVLLHKEYPTVARYQRRDDGTLEESAQGRRRGAFERNRTQIWENLEEAASRVRVVFAHVDGPRKPKPTYLGAWGAA
jgi:hypothetical protein